MVNYYKVVDKAGFVSGLGTNGNDFAEAITETEYNEILALLRDRPTAEPGYAYMLRDDNLEWELVRLPPEPEEPITEEEALTRYANELTGADDESLTEAAETLIKIVKEGN